MYSSNPLPPTPKLKMDSANWTWQTGEESPLTSPEMLAFSSTFLSLPPLSKGQFTALRLLQNPGSFLKQDVCLRPPSPQINNPQNLISGGRVEALESHYFHIPYPGALGLLRECGRPGAGKAQGCGGNLRPCARLQGEMSPGCITLGSEGRRRGFMTPGGEGGIANMLMQLSLHQTIPLSAYCRVTTSAAHIKTGRCLHSRETDT